MLKFGLFAALLVSAAPVLAQPPSGASPAQGAPSPAQQAAIQQSAMAMGQCIETAVQALAPTVTPEAGAASAMSGCATQRQQLVQAVEALIATLPEAARAGAREQLQTRLAGAEGQIANGIRMQRSAPPAAAATPGQ
jgi:hypothetical protein